MTKRKLPARPEKESEPRQQYIYSVGTLLSEVLTDTDQRDRNRITVILKQYGCNFKDNPGYGFYWIPYPPAQPRRYGIVLIFETKRGEVLVVAGNSICKEGDAWSKQEGLRVAAKRAIRKLEHLLNPPTSNLPTLHTHKLSPNSIIAGMQELRKWGLLKGGFPLD